MNKQGFVPVAIEEYADLFSVNRAGEVCRLSDATMMSPHLVGKGYERVWFNGAGRPGKMFYVHRVVAETFLGPPNGRHVNHKNGNRTDNRAENLEWVTPGENNLHAIRSGLRSVRGEKNSRSTLTNQQVREVWLSPERGADISRRLGISYRAVSDIRRGRTWTHVTSQLTTENGL